MQKSISGTHFPNHYRVSIDLHDQKKITTITFTLLGFFHWIWPHLFHRQGRAIHKIVRTKFALRRQISPPSEDALILCLEAFWSYFFSAFYDGEMTSLNRFLFSSNVEETRIIIWLARRSKSSVISLMIASWAFLSQTLKSQFFQLQISPRGLWCLLHLACMDIT